MTCIFQVNTGEFWRYELDVPHAEEPDRILDRRISSSLVTLASAGWDRGLHNDVR